ncbi:hypothetical protein [Amycolatopsis eburnea]|uniref:Uncharacterized protein n=1 Tax=Amycolatopsis eburnea TaxID=2267691 RepID=A0A427TGG9_9PSEU|nr:hypothetical protein [Amycolatopsis eburnea]RSD21966.1 hypothetical protein EIY87_09115 [Amycolatopsis eburnea]
MITTDLTADQLEQLAALLADTTPGAASYRPPVARDIEILRGLETAGLSRWTPDCGYEITAAGRDVVKEHAWDAADGEAFLREAPSAQLRKTIRDLRAFFHGSTDPVLRERALVDVEAIQDELDARADSESTGRHRAVPADDRPTEAIDRVELPTEPMPLSGTLPGLPVAEVVSPDYGEKLLAAIQDTPGPDDVAEFLAEQHTAAEWAELEADLGDDDSRWGPPVVPGSVLAVSVVAAIVVTWFAAWLVIG